MARIAIQSLGPAQRLGAAAVPLPARGAQAYASRGIVDGQPGTQAIPAPRPAAVPRDVTAQAITGGYHRSGDAAPVWYPGIYYERPGPDGYEHAPVSVLSDNQIPLPAVNPLGLPAVMQGRPRLGGQFQIENRATVPAYPPMGSSG
jgi:hypothetical protein